MIRLKSLVPLSLSMFLQVQFVLLGGRCGRIEVNATEKRGATHDAKWTERTINLGMRVPAPSIIAQANTFDLEATAEGY